MSLTHQAKKRTLRLPACEYSRVRFALCLGLIYYTASMDSLMGEDQELERLLVPTLTMQVAPN